MTNAKEEKELARKVILDQLYKNLKSVKDPSVAAAIGMAIAKVQEA